MTYFLNQSSIGLQNSATTCYRNLKIPNNNLLLGGNLQLVSGGSVTSTISNNDLTWLSGKASAVYANQSDLTITNSSLVNLSNTLTNLSGVVKGYQTSLVTGSLTATNVYSNLYWCNPDNAFYMGDLKNSVHFEYGCGTSSSLVYIDFHTNRNNVQDFDARLRIQGQGKEGNGTSTMNFYSGGVYFFSNLQTTQS